MATMSRHLHAAPAPRCHIEANDRPISILTDQCLTEFEDDDSDTEQHSLQSSDKSVNERRRSETTISSYGEVTTPQTEHDPFEILIKPVEGPQGPHLFRRSQSSAEFVFDSALQMSPLDLPAKYPSAAKTVGKSNPKLHRGQRESPNPILPGIPGLPRELRHWSSEDVVDWMFSTGIELGIIRLFRENDITGPVLLDMSFEHLKDLGIQSFGKRHQIWSSICSLKGGALADSTFLSSPQSNSPRVTPMASSDENDELRSLCSDTSMEDLTPDPAATSFGSPARKPRRQRKHPYQPLDLIDCVGIEYTLPKEHKCKKGKTCKSWQRWYRKVQRAEKFTAELNECIPKNNGAVDDVGYPPVPPQSVTNDFLSEGIPSIIASSDVLGPGQFSAVALQETALQQIKQRDPQENVKQFLQFQHVVDPVEVQSPQGDQAFEEKTFETFPSTYHQPHSTPVRQASTLSRDHRTLPRLLIPRAETASPNFPVQPSTFQSPIRLRSPQSALSDGRGVHFSPDHAFRTTSPASDIYSPGGHTLDAAVMRDFSQSVPPNMHYREQNTPPRPPTRLTKRRPSSTLPSVAEDASSSFSPILRPSTTTTRRTNSETSDLDKIYHTRDTSGDNCSHAGYMKKREPLLHLRKWRWAHFRLHGTTLDMHSDQRASSKQLDSINVADYTVNCCGAGSSASESKLAAALKSTLRLGGAEKDPASFAFQLVPERGGGKVERLRPGGMRTHHFAVGNRDDRIDWMRDLMLAKAKEKRSRGFSVQINGQI